MSFVCRSFCLSLTFVFVSQCLGQAGFAQDAPAKENWIQLFNGKDFEGWTPKIRYHDLGDNYGNTFRVQDGLLQVRYDKDKYETYGEKFGHLFYKQPYSHYRLRVEYRFVG